MKIVYEVDDVEQFFELQEGNWTVGRSSSATFTIRNDTISKVHAAFEFQDGKLTVKDLDSSNGVFVNGVKVEEQLLQPTDRVKIGNIKFNISMSQEELAIYHGSDTSSFSSNSEDNSDSGELTPAGGVEAVVDVNPDVGEESKTFFDVQNYAPAQVLANSPAVVAAPGSAAESPIKLLMQNRKLLLIVLGGAVMLFLMLIVLLNDPNEKRKPTKSRKIQGVISDKYEENLKQGSQVFLSEPVKALEFFKKALKITTKGNTNTASSLIELTNLWIDAKMSWLGVDRHIFRRILDDIRLEDEGQPGAVMYDFVLKYSRLEKDEEKNEIKFAEIVQLLSRDLIKESKEKLQGIPASSSIKAKARLRISNHERKLIKGLKERINAASRSGERLREIRLLNELMPMLLPADRLDYLSRLGTLRKGVAIEKVFAEGIRLFEKGDLAKAQILLKELTEKDAKYYAAQKILKKIRFINTKKKAEFFYNDQGDGKNAILILNKLSSSKLIAYEKRIKAVMKLFKEAKRHGRHNPDSIKAQNKLKELMALENNEDNKYYQRAKALLAKWTDKAAKAKRIFAGALNKLRTRDYVSARSMCVEVKKLKPDFDISRITKKVNSYVSKVLNTQVRNEKSVNVRKEVLTNLEKMVYPEDEHHDYIITQLEDLKQE